MAYDRDRLCAVLRGARPNDLVRHARRAEEVGFTFAELAVGVKGGARTGLLVDQLVPVSVANCLLTKADITVYALGS